MSEVAGLWNQVIDDDATLWSVLESFAATGHPTFSLIHQKLDSLRRSADGNVHEFLGAASKELRPWSNLDGFIREISVWLEELRAHSQHSEGAVRIMTLQAAKGLEADVVCVVGLDEGVLPRLDSSPEAVTEAARLTYVSMTRAIAELHLFHARKRDASTTYLPESYALKPSRFVEAIGAAQRETKFYAAKAKKKGKLARNLQ